MGRGQKHGKKNGKQNNVNLLEGLESRQLLSSVTLSGGVLKVTGNSSSANNMGVHAWGGDLIATHNGVQKSYSASSVSRIELAGGSAGDNLWIHTNVTKNSVIRGNGGNDTLTGGSGRDTIYAGSGNDKLYGRDGDDNLNGEDGADTLWGGSGSDRLNGGSGSDVRYDEQYSGGVSSDAGAAPAPISNTAGTISLSSGVLKVTGFSSAANQVAVSASGSSIVVSHNGATKSYSLSSVSRIEITGGSAADSLRISNSVTKSSVIRGNGGNDTISGGNGRDTIYAGSGNDKLYGNDGNDSLSGEDGDDSLWGEGGTDTLSGGSGNDVRYDEKYSGGVSRDVPLTTPDDDDDNDDDGGSIPQNNSGDAPTAVITTRGSSIQAGHAVFVHGLSSSLRDGNPNTARYEWDFGDDGSKYDKMLGFNAAHVYDDPGTYTVKLTVWNQSGRSDTATTTIRVASSTRKKIYVSSSGSDSNSGSSSSPIRTMAKAHSMLGSNTEILFRRGDTFTTTTGLRVDNNDNVLIGAYGSGSRPVLKYTGPRGWTALVSNYSGGYDLTVQDVTLDSHFTTGTSSDEIPVGVKPNGNNTLVRNIEFRNLGYAVQGNGLPDGLLVQDNTSPSMTEVRSYFSYAQGSDHVYLGNHVANVRGHVIRTDGVTRVNISHNNFSNPVDSDGTTRGTLTIHEGSYAYVGGNKLSKGKVTIGPLGEGNGLNDKGARWYWGVFEGNDINSPVIVEHGAEHVMFRNNTVESHSGFAIQIEGYNSTYGRGVADVTITNNTGYNASTRGNFLDVAGNVNGITLTNNLYIAPRLTTGSYDTAAVRVFDNNLDSFRRIDNNVWPTPYALHFAQGGVNYVWPTVSNSAGYQTPSEWNAWSKVGEDMFSDVAYSSSTFAPSSSSIAANAAEWSAGVFTDYYGKWRGTGSWSAGAIEV